MIQSSFSRLLFAVTILAGFATRMPAQIYSFTMLAGSANSSGSADGTGSAARFSSPQGVAADRSGNIYVADTGNHTIRKITADGVVTTLAGAAGISGSADGTGSAARFLAPQGVAADRNGNVFVADTGNSTIRKITTGGVVTTFAGLAQNSGLIDGAGSAARFASFVHGLAVDASGNVFVADRLNRCVRKITADGVVTTLTPNFFEPTGVAVDDSGNVFVTANFSGTLRKLSPDGVVVTLVTTGAATPIFLNGVAVDGSGNAFALGVNLFKFTVGGAFVTPGHADIPGSAGGGDALAVDGNGTVFFASSSNHTISKAVPLANPARLINVSVLATLADSGDTLTLGTIIGGAGSIGTKPLLVRAAGPSLAPFGVTGLLADPKFESFSGQTKINENDDWGGAASVSAVFTQVGAFPFAASTSKDAALAVPAVGTGNNTVRVSGNGTAGGMVLAELYDATPAAALTPTTPRLINVSVLKNIGAGLTVGFIVKGEGRKTVLIRAVGPSLAPFGVSGLLVDPMIELFDGQSQSMTLNNNWSDAGAQAEADFNTVFKNVGAFALVNRFSKDAALLTTLTPGNYTVQVRSADSTTGVALVEVYEVP